MTLKGWVIVAFILAIGIAILREWGYWVFMAFCFIGSWLSPVVISVVEDLESKRF